MICKRLIELLQEIPEETDVSIRVGPAIGDASLAILCHPDDKLSACITTFYYEVLDRMEDPSEQTIEDLRKTWLRPYPDEAQEVCSHQTTPRTWPTGHMTLR